VPHLEFGVSDDSYQAKIRISNDSYQQRFVSGYAFRHTENRAQTITPLGAVIRSYTFLHLNYTAAARSSEAIVLRSTSAECSSCPRSTSLNSSRSTFSIPLRFTTVGRLRHKS
jgi:hypothetical protein